MGSFGGVPFYPILPDQNQELRIFVADSLFTSVI